MPNLLVEQYYYCLAPLEQAACRLALSSNVPPYIFVIPKTPIDDLYAASPVNFDGRQENWAAMFHFVPVEIDIGMGVTVWAYTDLYGFLDDWRLYTTIHGGWLSLPCRENDYVLDPT